MQASGDAACWGWCVFDIQDDNSEWAPAIPARRGGQKKEAIRIQQSQEESQPEQDGKRRGYAAHPELGSLYLTFAKGKSYMVCSFPLPGCPGMVAQFTQHQVGEKHPALLVSLATMASEKSLNREQIKQLRDTIVAQHRFARPGI